ncbi:hypothetical protein F6B41_23770 [Microbacterium lushaniae]|nr:hypothetical protein F6B41_23770 [Microbacterium lushaniae]
MMLATRFSTLKVRDDFRAGERPLQPDPLRIQLRHVGFHTWSRPALLKQLSHVAYALAQWLL